MTMTRRIACGTALCAVLALVPAGARAHPGHDHTVMGTVKSIRDGHLEIQTKDGKVSTFMIEATTKILRGKERVATADIKVGERVVAVGATPTPPAGGGHDMSGQGAAGMLVAKEIRLGAAKPAASE